MFHIGDFARGLETVYEPEVVADVKKRLHEAAAELRFEYAARLRDEISDLKKELRQMTAATR